MIWTTLKYSKGEINAAGKIIQKDSIWIYEHEEAVDKVNNWRASHGFPLNVFQMRLRRCSKLVYKNATVSQRIKRVTSIKNKLVGYEGMTVCRMQDIAGCRAVVKNINQVYDLFDRYYETGKYELHLRGKVNDYIKEPKVTGYRSLHIVYTYNSTRNTKFNGYKIEIQIRTRLQHAWATALEVVENFTKEPLKSGKGDSRWLNFFRLVSSAFSIMENAPLSKLYSTPEPNELRREIAKEFEALQVADILDGMSNFLKSQPVKAKDAHYFALSLNSESKHLQVFGFYKKYFSKAIEKVFALEKEMPNNQNVLVTADNLSALRRAFPNYYQDTELFTRKVLEFVMNKR